MISLRVTVTGGLENVISAEYLQLMNSAGLSGSPLPHACFCKQRCFFRAFAFFMCMLISLKKNAIFTYCSTSQEYSIKPVADILHEPD